jgi:hypothetical protein
MVELDLASLQGRIEAAQAAIRQAMNEFVVTQEYATEEMRAMNSALGNLQTLQRVALRGSNPVRLGLSSDRGAT